jgi:hypothetical protein
MWKILMGYICLGLGILTGPLGISFAVFYFKQRFKQKIWVRSNFLKIKLEEFHKLLQETEPNLKFRCSERFAWFTFELDVSSHVELHEPSHKNEEREADRMGLVHPPQLGKNLKEQSYDSFEQRDEEIPQEPGTNFVPVD